MLTGDDFRTVLIEALTGAANALRKARAADPPTNPEAVRPDASDGTATATINGKLVLNVSEAAEMLGIGRTGAYKLLGTGELHSIRIGGRVLIPIQALLDFLAAAPDR